MRILTYLALVVSALVGASTSSKALTALDYKGSDVDILGVIDQESNVPAKPVARVYFAAMQTNGKWAVFMHDARKNGGDNVKASKLGEFSQKPDQFVNDRRKPYFHVPGKGLYTVAKVNGKLKAVKIFNTDPDPSKPMYGLICWDESKLAFAAYNSATGYEPWISNGKKSGTKMLKDVNPGAADSFADSFTGQHSDVGALVPAKLFFSASNGPVATADGYQLWVSNGKTDETFSINVTRQDSDNNNGAGRPYYLANVNETIFFANSGNDDEDSLELWTSQGSIANTFSLSRTGTNGPSGISPYNIVNGALAPLAASSVVAFFAGSDSSGSELWSATLDFVPSRITNINAASSSNISDIVPGNDNGMVYFKAFNGTTYDLYRQFLGVTSVIAGSTGADLRQITPASQQLYFVANNKLRRVENISGQETSFEILDNIDQPIPTPGDLHSAVSPASPGLFRLYFVQGDKVSFVDNPTVW